MVELWEPIFPQFPFCCRFFLRPSLPSRVQEYGQTVLFSWGFPPPLTGSGWQPALVWSAPSMPTSWPPGVESHVFFFFLGSPPPPPCVFYRIPPPTLSVSPPLPLHDRETTTDVEFDNPSFPPRCPAGGLPALAYYVISFSGPPAIKSCFSLPKVSSRDSLFTPLQAGRPTSNTIFPPGVGTFRRSRRWAIAWTSPAEKSNASPFFRLPLWCCSPSHSCSSSFRSQRTHYITGVVRGWSGVSTSR